MTKTRKHVYLSDMEAYVSNATWGLIHIDPINVDLAYEIVRNPEGVEYANFPNIKELVFDRDDVSLSKQEQSELVDYLDSVARRLDD